MTKIGQEIKKLSDKKGLLIRYNIFETQDPEELRRMAARIFNFNQNISTRLKKKFFFCMNHVELGNVTLSYVVSDSSLEIKAGEVTNNYFLLIQKEGRAYHIIDKQKFTTVPGRAVIYSPKQNIVLKTSGPAGILAVSISRASMESYISRRMNKDLHNSLKILPAIDLTTGPGKALERLIMYICQELDAMDGLIQFSPLSIRHLQRTIFAALLDGQPHNYSRKMCVPMCDTSIGLVFRAEEFIHNNIEKPLSSGEIAAAMGVSERSLYRSFSRHRKSTPMKNLRLARLQRVRSILKEGIPGTTVISVAMNYGFFHLGRFSKFYKTRFGELPSITLRRAREKL